jgi:hypothetical protein
MRQTCQGSGATPLSTPNQRRPPTSLTTDSFGQNFYAKRAVMLLKLLLFLALCIMLLVGSWTSDKSARANVKRNLYGSDLRLLATCIPSETRAKKLPLGKQLRLHGIVNVSRHIKRSLGLRPLIKNLLLDPTWGQHCALDIFSFFKQVHY